MQEIALRRGCPPVNLLYVFRTSFPKNTSGGLLLLFQYILDFCGSYRILESIEIKGTLVRRGLKLEEIQLEPLIADSVFLLKNRLGPLLHITMPHNIEGQKSWRAHCVKSVQIRTRNNSVTLFTQWLLTSHHNIFRGNRKLLENILNLNRLEGIYNVKEY